MKNLLNKKVLLTIGAMSVVIVAALVCISFFYFKPIPKPPVPERIVRDPGSLPEATYNEYSHRRMLSSKDGNASWVRIRITDVKKKKYYWNLPAAMKNIPGILPDDIMEDDKGLYTLSNESKFDVLEVIYGEELKKEHLIYTDVGFQEDLQRGHELIIVAKENNSENYEDGAKGYTTGGYNFFVDENNKIATTVPVHEHIYIEQFEGMDVDDFINDIKEELKDEK